MQDIIQTMPERFTPKGRTVRPTYLLRFNYPPLLSGGRVEVTVTGNPMAAMTFNRPEVLDSALALLRSLGYDPEVMDQTEAHNSL